jgi:hypothetical protein
VLDEIWLPGALFKGLSAERLAAWRGPMYRLFEAEFGVQMIRAERTIRAVPPRATTRRLLAVPPGTPLLSVERLSYTYGDKPVECAAACTVPRPTTTATSSADRPRCLLPQFHVRLLRCNKLSRFHTRVHTSTPCPRCPRPNPPGTMRLVDALQYRLPLAGVVSILHRASGG